jgi:TPR repeat protein
MQHVLIYLSHILTSSLRCRARNGSITMNPRSFIFFWIIVCFFSATVFAENVGLEKIKIQGEKGNAPAQFKLGVMYFRGKGTSQNYQEALKWFQKAAQQGLSEAQYNTGVMYYQGKGVTLDYTKAFEWFNKAAKQNNPKAQYNLGIMYASGEGVPQDYVKAYAWMSLAYSNGYDRAKNNILILNKAMTASEMEEATALADKIRQSLENDH